MKKMNGGDLEVALMEKKKALEMVARGQDIPTEIINYEMPGKMILAQGSEILHHVTPVKSKDIRYIFSTPIDCIRPLILQRLRKFKGILLKQDINDFRVRSSKQLSATKNRLGYHEKTRFEASTRRLRIL